MAKSSCGIETLIKTTFPLQVAVRCSEEVEFTCQKNNLSFSEMLKPFCALSNNVQLRDIQGHLYNLRNVRIRFSEPPSQPIPESKLRILLGETVQSTASDHDDGQRVKVRIGNVSALASTPWFDAYRDTYLDFLKQSDHETIRHYISVVLVVPSTSEDPIEEFSKLYTQQKQSESNKHPKWLSPHIFYYHVLLHDVVDGATDIKRVEDNFVLVKTKYGDGRCHLLQLNSCSSSDLAAPDVWSHYFKTSATTGVGIGQDETDHGVFKKFHFRRKPSKNKHNGPIPNNAQPEETPNLTSTDVIKPTQEPQLITSDPNLSSMVETGEDPLSQLAATTSLPKDEISNKRTPNSIVDHNLVNQSDLLNSDESHVVQYGQCLSEDDHRNIRNFVMDLVARRLLPHFNEVLRNLNEWLLSRRTVRRSFSNMLRGLKMFGGPNNVMTDETNYTSNSLEMQLRQLADIAFLLQNYDLALHSYYQVKKDFQSSNAWLYYGGAVEMCAVTAYLLSSTRRDAVSHLEEAISVYNLSCKAPYYSIRASLLLIDIYKERGLYKELTQLCMRMTSEDADLRSAVCLEQAAHAFLRSKPSMPRKYALHLILAGNRYARAAQRLHSLHAYQQALEIYQGKGWTMAEDYVQFCLAKHSFNLHRLVDARTAFEKLLSHESVQSPSLQRMHLQDYIYVHKQLLLAENPPVSSTPLQISLTTPTTSQSLVDGVRSIPFLPLPFIKPQLTRVTFTTAASPDSLNRTLSVDAGDSNHSKHRSISFKEPQSDSGFGIVDDMQVISKLRSSSTDSKETIGNHLSQIEAGNENFCVNIVMGKSDYTPSREEMTGKVSWEELEKQAASGISGTLHENFSPSVQVMDEESDNSEMPITVVGESIAVGVVLKNPLKGVPLLMTNLCLVWDATPAKCTTPSSLSPSASAVCEVVKRVLLQPEEERMVTLHMTPLKEGELVVKGFIYNLCIESNQSSRSSSPLIAGVSKANSLTLSLNSRDSLYQVHQGSGFQSLLAEGVQGRVEFEVRGPRLNDSKREKASLVYKKDYRLHWRVTPPMPKIVTALSGLPTFMLTGELTRVGVEVFNVGQVALNSLRLTSSLGPQLLLDEVSSELHHCPIYPSTLLSPLDHSPGSSTPVSTPSLPSGTFSPCCLELPLPQGRLEPGKGIRTKLVMQGTPFLLSSSGYGAGEIPWNIVFYYEPALISANSRLSHRVLRHSCILHVRESLQLRATAVHSLLPRSTSSTVDGRQRIDLNQLVITLEAENKCQLTHSSAVEMRISQISCMSRKWRVYKLDRNQGLLCLLPSENGVIHLKGSLLEYSTSSVRVHSDVPLGSTIIPSHLFPVKDLFSGRDGVSSLGIDSGQDTCTRSEGGGERNSEEEIVLIVFWQALVPTTGSDTLFSYGHHTITVPLPQSMSALRESVQPPSPYDLVKFHLEHPITYHHRGFVKTDIAATPPGHENSISSLCRVPVKIVLQNCHHQVVKAMVELLQPKDGTHQDPKRYSEISLFWSGGCKRQIKLEASSTRTLSVFANFCWPGVYNLNTLRVLAARGDSSNYHVQRWQRTSYITIE